MAKWIDVTYEKPDDTRDILIVWTGEVYLGYYKPNAETWYCYEPGRTTYAFNVTHWQDLPKPPKETI